MSDMLQLVVTRAIRLLKLDKFLIVPNRLMKGALHGSITPAVRYASACRDSSCETAEIRQILNRPNRLMKNQPRFKLNPG